MKKKESKAEKKSTCVFLQTDDTANHREIEPSFLNMRTESILTSLKVADIGILTKNTCWLQHVTESQISL